MKSEGIALIQVLLITAMLSVFALYLTSTAKDQVTMAKWSDDKAKALVALQSAESELLFTLFTQKKLIHTGDDSAINPLTKQWNFFAKPFMANEVVSVKVQDLAGLLHIHYINSKHLSALIASHETSSAKANHLVDNLLDWQDLDNIPHVNGTESADYLSNRLLANAKIRNGTLPDLYDLIFVKQFSPDLVSFLAANTSMLGQGYFNPMTATEDILTALVGNSLALQITALRNNNQLTQEFLTKSAGIKEDDSTFFYPSNHLAIELTSNVGETQVKKSITIHLSPYASDKKQPLNILAARG